MYDSCPIYARLQQALTPVAMYPVCNESHGFILVRLLAWATDLLNSCQSVPCTVAGGQVQDAV